MSSPSSEQTTPRRVTLLRPGSPQLWAGILFLLLFAALALQPIQPADFWWQLQVGEIVLDEGQIPRQDLFSYTLPSDQPYLYQSWLAGTIFALLFRLGGPELVITANALMIVAAYALLWSACRQVGQGNESSIADAPPGHPHKATLCTAAAILVSAGNWGVRPQTFSTLLVALFLWILVRYRRPKGRRRGWLLWLLPPLVALWANLHGAFALGVALLGAATAGELLKPLLPSRPFPSLPWRSRLALLGATLLSLAAPLLNPWGPQVYHYLWRIQRHPVIRQAIAEWQPPRIDNGVGAIFFLSLLGLFFLLLYRRWRPDPVLALWLAGTTWLALGSVRSILWYSLVMALSLAGALADLGWPRPATPSRPQINLALLGILTLLALLTLPWFKGLLPLPPELQGTTSPDTPQETTSFLIAEELQGPIFHRMELGGYLLWRLYPERRVFIDPRIELYPPELWEAYGQIAAGGPEALALLDRYEVDILLLDIRHQPGLLERVRDSDRWRVRYENGSEESILFIRRTP